MNKFITREFQLACLVACLPVLAHCSAGAPGASLGPQALSSDGPSSGGVSSDSGVSGSTGASSGKGLTGNFSSRQCETVGDRTYQLRHYAFTATGVTATWDRFSNALCSVDSKLMSIDMTGTSMLTEPSTQVPGAQDIIVSIATKTVAPTAAGLPIVEQVCGEYPWQAGAAQTITTGCGALLQQTNDCPTEYDLLAVTMVGVVFGDRSHPLCSETTRPTKLSQWSIVPDPAGYASPATADAGAATEGGGSPSDDASAPSTGSFAGTYACTVSQDIAITAPLSLPNAGGPPVTATMVVTEAGAALTATLTGDRGLSCALTFTDNGNGTATLSPADVQSCDVTAANAFGKLDVPATLTFDTGGTAVFALPSLHVDGLAASVSNASLGLAGTGTLSADCTKM